MPAGGRRVLSAGRLWIACSIGVHHQLFALAVHHRKNVLLRCGSAALVSVGRQQYYAGAQGQIALCPAARVLLCETWHRLLAYWGGLEGPEGG